MPQSRQSKVLLRDRAAARRAGPPGPPSLTCASAPGRRCSAFTLIELIFVLALLAISALLIVGQMGGFFRGRALNFEARRLLSLTQYGQSRAVSEGVPVVLWVNIKDSTYGLSVLSSFSAEDGDVHATSYAVEPSLTLETPLGETPLVSEDDDEQLGLPEGLAAIRFNPDGFIDESSITKIIIRQGADAALALVPTGNRLSFEIQPVANLN